MWAWWICYAMPKHLLATTNQEFATFAEKVFHMFLKMDLSTVHSNFIKVISATFIDD